MIVEEQSKAPELADSEIDIIGDKTALRHQLEQAPFIEINDLFAYVSIVTDEQIDKDVNVRAIVATPNATDWGLEDFDRICSLVNSIYAKRIDLGSIELPELFEIDGVYGVLSDGRHRVAAMKLLSYICEEELTIRAKVSKVQPFTDVFAFTEADYQELIKRKEQGLWQGTVEAMLTDSIPTGFCAIGKIDSYEGPWVFSKDMEKAKMLSSSKTRVTPHA